MSVSPFQKVKIEKLRKLVYLYYQEGYSLRHIAKLPWVEGRSHAWVHKMVKQQAKIETALRQKPPVVDKIVDKSLQ